MRKKEINRKMAVCVKLDTTDDSTFEILIDPQNETEFVVNSYLLEITNERMVQFYHILDVINADKERIKKFGEKYNGSHFFFVNDKYIYVTDLNEFFLDTRKKFELSIRFALYDINNHFDELKKKALDDERKDYLVERYLSENDDFQKHDSQKMENWYSELNVFDYDINQIFSIHKFNILLSNILEGSDDIINVDKIALKGILDDKCKKKIGTVIPDGMIQGILDSPPTICSDEEAKDIVWNYRTIAEFRINFHFLWDLIKNVLALIYVPLILVLLQEGISDKIYLYSVLAVVYVIALFFSNEKQTERLILFFSKRGKQISYATLFQYGMYVSIYFIVFSVEIINGLIGSKIELLIYLVADVAVTFTVAYFGLLICTLLPCVFISLEYSRLSRKFGKAFLFYTKKIYISLIYFLSVCATFWVLGVKTFIQNETPISDGRLAFGLVVLLFAAIRIYSTWQIKDNTNKSQS